MNIWIIAENWPPRVGGIERYITGIAESLAKHEHDITVFAPPGSAKMSGVSVIASRIFWPIIKPSWMPFALYLLVRAMMQKPDAIICGKTLFEGRVARIVKKILGAPYIVCTYGMEIATWKSNIKTSTQASHVLHDAAFVLVMNKQTKESVITLGAHEERVMFMYPGIDTDKLDQKNNPDDVLKKYDITAPYILTVSRLVKRKGIDDLLRAMAIIKKSIVVVGDGPERSNLEQLAQKLDIDAKFLGAISDEDVHALYSRAQLFALTPKELPGDYEGFGIVYNEAAYFGLPVIGTNTGGVPEAVQDGVTGILAQPGDTTSISQAITTLLENPDKAKHYGEMGKQRVTAEFTWNSIIGSLEDILTSL
ncbi:MAG: glycosyltransferase family 4 protein [Candidatus Andersenbacteria bacterium]|nr:glycosyltransferase family 4 protein [Candidatus Andersenbacteria bacterium]